MKLAFVVQRYGAQINGGAELHARYIVELLARQHRVEVLTTCSRDYVTWRNEWPEGTETMRGVPVRRFRVSRERDVQDFGQRSAHVFGHKHSVADELAWIDSEGPTSPELIAHVTAHANDYDYIFFFSYRYYLAYHGARAVASKAILVPTAERDEAIGLSIFGPVFRSVRAIMYNSPEERVMIQTATGNTQVPGVVVGVGSDVPRHPVASRFRRKYKIDDPFIIYVGRIDENKGCRELFSFFTTYRPQLGQRLKLVLIGQSIIPIPEHPNIHHLGFVSDQDKFDAMAAADALVMPSYYESLSMVALEAWALGKPVLANGRCDVLRGQCVRSRAGLYYENFEEFAETLFTLTTHRSMAEALGDNGRAYFEQHYAWPVIERKYQDVLDHLAREDKGGRAASAPEPLPGWMARRRKTLPPATDVLKTLPTGAVIGDDAFELNGALATSAARGARAAGSGSPASAAASPSIAAFGAGSQVTGSSSRFDDEAADSAAESGRTSSRPGPGGSSDRDSRSPAAAGADPSDRQARGRGDRDRDRGRSAGRRRGAGSGSGSGSGSSARPEGDAGAGSAAGTERSEGERREGRSRSGEPRRSRSDRGDRGDRSPRGDRGDRGDAQTGGAPKPEGGGRPEGGRRSERGPRPEGSGRPERTPRAEGDSQRVRPEGSGRPEGGSPEGGNRPERAPRAEGDSQGAKPEGSGRSEGGRPEGGSRPERAPRAEGDSQAPRPEGERRPRRDGIRRRRPRDGRSGPRGGGGGTGSGGGGSEGGGTGGQA